MNKITDLQALKPLSEEQLLDACKTQSQASAAAYTELVNRHQHALFKRCRTRLGNVADAEDALQETLIRAYRGLPGFRNESSFRTWLFSIADNQCNTLHVRRSRHVLTDHLQSLIELHHQLRAGTISDVNADQIEQARDTLAQLPGQARDVLTLRFYYDLALEEIASTLGLGLSATKMRLYRAIGLFETRFMTISEQAH